MSTANPSALEPEAATSEDQMPTYEYRCKSCDHGFETVQAFTDDSLTECPECGGPLKKVFGNVGITFKGSGFYKTDSRSAGSFGSAKDADRSDTGSSSDSSSTGKDAGASTTKSDAGSEKKSADKASPSTPSPSSPSASPSTGGSGSTPSTSSPSSTGTS